MSGRIGTHTEFRYIGPGYLVGVPARDLTAADLVEVEQREGITREMIEASGVYGPVHVVEVDPFCGAALTPGPSPGGRGGRRCRRRVRRWGERCYQHKEED